MILIHPRLFSVLSPYSLFTSDRMKLHHENACDKLERMFRNSQQITLQIFKRHSVIPVTKFVTSKAQHLQRRLSYNICPPIQNKSVITQKESS